MKNLTLTELKSLLSRWPVLLSWLVLAAIIAWSYNLALAGVVKVWWSSPDYGHGFFVPIFAIVLLWSRREMICSMTLEECWENWSLAVFGAVLGVVLGCLVFFANPSDGWKWYHLILSLVYGAGLGAGLLQLGVLFFGSDTINKPFSPAGAMWGLAFLALAVGLRLAGDYFYLFYARSLGLVVWMAGLTIFVGGWRTMRWAWPAVAMLVFMLPLPGAVSGMSAQTLQLVGTKASVIAIQTLGIPAIAQGNVIQLEADKALDVAETCSGLRMLMLFSAVCVGAAFILRCPLWEKVVIVLSAAPIAIFANVVRLSVTAIAYHLDWGKWFEHLAHDWIGYLMMILAILILWGEMTLLRKILLDPVSKRPLRVGGPLTPGVRNSNP